VTASIFYRLMEKMTSVDIPRDVGDFRLIGRKALDTFKQMPERNRFVRGMFGWMGFKQTAVSFERPARAAGETKYPFWKMLRLAVHGIIGFSEKPLRMALWGGLAISGLAALLGLFAIASWLFNLGVVQGWTSTVVIVSFLSGINLFMTGIVGLYVGGIHSEIKRRPLYVVDRLSGFEDAVRAEAENRNPRGGHPAGHARQKVWLMAELFDQYRATYNRTVDDSISFSGLKHDFFLQAKLDPLARLIAERGVAKGDGSVRALDVGCGVGAPASLCETAFFRTSWLRYLDGIHCPGASGKPLGDLCRLFGSPAALCRRHVRSRLRGLCCPPCAA